MKITVVGEESDESMRWMPKRTLPLLGLSAYTPGRISSLCTDLAGRWSQLNKFKLTVGKGDKPVKDSDVATTRRVVKVIPDPVEPLKEGELVETAGRNSSLQVTLSQATQILGKEVLTSLKASQSVTEAEWLAAFAEPEPEPKKLEVPEPILGPRSADRGA